MKDSINFNSKIFRKIENNVSAFRKASKVWNQFRTRPADQIAGTQQLQSCHDPIQDSVRHIVIGFA